MNYPLRYNIVLRTCCVLLILLIIIRTFDKKSFWSQLNMIGRWQLNGITIIGKNHETERNSGSFQRKLTNVGRKITIKLLNTRFTTNGVFSSEYKMAENDLINFTTGTWLVKEDSLFITLVKPLQKVLKFKVNVTDSVATFKGSILADDKQNGYECMAILKKCK